MCQSYIDWSALKRPLMSIPTGSSNWSHKQCVRSGFATSFADHAINTPYLQELTTTFINVAKRPASRSTATGSPAE